MKIMFICTGNICRSAMAEAFMKCFVEKDKELKGNIEVYSCGIFAEENDVPTLNAIEAMKEYGIDLKHHKATNIRNSNIRQMDLILCATRAHKQTVQQLYPERKGRVYTIKEYAKGEKKNLDVNDPWGYDIETYRFCASELESCIKRILERIKQ